VADASRRFTTPLPLQRCSEQRDFDLAMAFHRSNRFHHLVENLSLAHRLHLRDFLCFASAGIWLSDEYMIETEAGYKAAKSLLSLRERRVSAIVPGPVCPRPRIAVRQQLSDSGETVSPY
jgi:hypothetical protein